MSGGLHSGVASGGGRGVVCPGQHVFFPTFFGVDNTFCFFFWGGQLFFLFSFLYDCLGGGASQLSKALYTVTELSHNLILPWT